MATNLYFNNFGHFGQQTLIEDLIIESIKTYGYDVYYIPRTLVKEDDLFGEDILSKFDDSYQLEMYIKNVEGFEGEGTFLSKFNVEIRDEITFTVSVRRFTEEVDSDQLIKQEDGNNITRPLEGDLIYLPLTGGLFEIKFVDDVPVFYQMGELQMYDLRCELFEYSHEELDTGIPAIDDIQTRQSSIMQDFELNLEAYRAKAKATATLDGNTVSSITVDTYEKGFYGSAPTVTISAPPSGVTATATSTINSNGEVILVSVEENGSGYVTAPTVTFSAEAETGNLLMENGDTITNEDYRVDSIGTTANNEYIQTEATSSSSSLGNFLDFSEQNPFSEGSDW